MIKEQYTSNIKQTALNIVNSKVESSRQKNISKTGIRIYKDGFIGVAGAIGKYDEAKLTNDAVEALEQHVEYNCSPSENKCEKLDKSSEIINDKDFIGEFQETLESLSKEQNEFIFSNKIIMTEVTTSLKNDKNLDLEYKDKALNIELIFKEKSSSNIFDGFIGCGSRKYDRRKFLEESNMFLNAYKNIVELPKNSIYPVVFGNTSMDFFSKLAIDLNGKLFGTGSSLFSNKIGQQAFSDKFTFYQTSNPDDIYNTPFFDAEGVVNKDHRYALIENGVIKTPYTDKKTSKMFNLAHTGSAEAAYDAIPDIGLPGFKAKESNMSVKELLGGEMGIFILIASGGDSTPDGNFATPVQLGFLFDGEKLIGRLPEFQLSSNVFDMFGKSYRGVGCNNIFPQSEEKFVVSELNVSSI